MTKVRSDAVDACPCGSGASYESCCGRWHDGKDRLMAPTAEALV